MVSSLSCGHGIAEHSSWPSNQGSPFQTLCEAVLEVTRIGVAFWPLLTPDSTLGEVICKSLSLQAAGLNAGGFRFVSLGLRP